MQRNITVNEIETMSYPDFVAYLGQKNSPPGGLHTIKKWIEMGKISNQSYVLDLACSNGFSSREVAKIAKCSGEGVDISAAAIDVANNEAKGLGFNHLLKYQVADASLLPFKNETFTHVLGGCNFSFISNREEALKNCRLKLKKDGLLCLGNFYYIKAPPDLLLADVENAIGFRPQANWTKDWWDRFYGNQFGLVEEELNNLDMISEEYLKKEIYFFIYEKCHHLSKQSDEIKNTCFNKLFQIRKTLNEHRKYQKYSISIWRRF